MQKTKVLVKEATPEAQALGERVAKALGVPADSVQTAEIGTIAWLLASGLDPVEAVAGVLLYRVFLVALEIPVGGTLLGAWALLRRDGGGRRSAGLVA